MQRSAQQTREKREEALQEQCTHALRLTKLRSRSPKKDRIETSRQPLEETGRGTNKVKEHTSYRAKGHHTVAISRSYRANRRSHQTSVSCAHAHCDEPSAAAAVRLKQAQQARLRM